MKLAIAQVNPWLGDVDYNVALVQRAVACAQSAGADVVVFPELVLTGYPPRDLLFDRDFVRRVQDATAALARSTEVGPAIVLGTVIDAPSARPGHPGLYNAAVVLQGGRQTAYVAKQLLPTYDVFNEARWFAPAPPQAPIELCGHKIGLLLCEDMWDEGYDTHPVRALADAGASLLICMSASPYRWGAWRRRLYHARRAGLPIVYVNTVGAQDELIFDGSSFALDSHGRITHWLRSFAEAVQPIHQLHPVQSSATEIPEETEEMLFDALVLGVRDFARKNRVRRAFLGLSGGVDSALVACIAAEALGPAAVTAIAMPSRHTDPRSTSEARRLAEALGIHWSEIPIDTLHRATEETLSNVLGENAASDVARENIQARVRAMILMAHVNRFGGLLLNTSNKTELSLGYGTLYGDLAGDLSVIGDLTKTQVYALARRRRNTISSFILDRPPSAELRPEQVDPFDYPRVSPAVEAMVAGETASRDLREELQPDLRGDPDLPIDCYRRMLRQSEHKRWQAPIVLKVSERAFGSGRMMPVTHGYTVRSDENVKSKQLDVGKPAAPRALDGTAALQEADDDRVLA